MHMGCWGSKPVWPPARQVFYLLYYGSSPHQNLFIIEPYQSSEEDMNTTVKTQVFRAAIYAHYMWWSSMLLSHCDFCTLDVLIVCCGLDR